MNKRIKEILSFLLFNRRNKGVTQKLKINSEDIFFETITTRPLMCGKNVIKIWSQLGHV
jgi:hypothetical protein